MHLSAKKPCTALVNGYVCGKKQGTAEAACQYEGGLAVYRA